MDEDDLLIRDWLIICQMISDEQIDKVMYENYESQDTIWAGLLKVRRFSSITKHIGTRFIELSFEKTYQL